MSYMKDIDEYTDEELQAELDRRRAAFEAGICDYCGRDGRSEPLCRFHSRHYQAAVIAQRLAKEAAGIPVVGSVTIRIPR